MIPASRGCSHDVLFLGRKTSLMFVKFSCKVSGKHVALSQDKTNLSFSKHILRSSLDKILSNDVWDIGFNGFLRDTKQGGLFDLEIAVGSKTKDPSEVTISITVMRCLDFLSPLVLSPLKISLVKLWIIIQAFINLIHVVVLNPGTTLIIAQSKLILLLCKPHRLQTSSTFLTIYS